VHVPLHTSGFYYLILINFRLKLFEVLYPNTKFRFVSDHAEVAIKNFKMAFKLSYKHSLVKVDAMQTTYRSVCSSDKEYVASSLFFLFISSSYQSSNYVLFYQMFFSWECFWCYFFPFFLCSDVGGVMIISYQAIHYIVTSGCWG
jgi:hypothetical protein